MLYLSHPHNNDLPIDSPARWRVIFHGEGRESSLSEESRCRVHGDDGCTVVTPGCALSSRTHVSVGIKCGRLLSGVCQTAAYTVGNAGGCQKKTAHGHCARVCLFVCRLGDEAITVTSQDFANEN